MRRALQYGAVTGRPHRAALRGADALARRPDARGRGLRRARLHRLSVGRREPDGRARPRARRLRAAAAAPAAPLRVGVGRGARRARADGVAGDRRGDAAPPVPDRRGGPVARPEREDEPAAARRAPTGRRCIEGLQRRDDRARSPPTTRRTRGTRRRCRSRRRRSASPASRPRSPRSTPTSSSRASLPLETLLERMSAGPGARYGLDEPRDRRRRAGEPRPARPERELAGRRRTASARARSTRGCSARRSRAGRADGRRRAAGVRGMTRLPRARGRHGLPRRVGRRRRASPSARRSSRPR